MNIMHECYIKALFILLLLWLHVRQGESNNKYVHTGDDSVHVHVTG